MRGARPAGLAGPPLAAPSGGGPRRSSSGPLKRCGSTPLTITASSSRPELVVQALLQLQRLGDRHLGRVGDGDVARARRVLEQLAQAIGLSGDRADARDRAERARRVEQAERVAGGRGVEHDEVVAAPATALGLGQVPDLHHAHQLLRAGRGGGEVLEGAARREHPPRDAPAERLQPFQQRSVGVDRDAPQALAKPGLRPGSRRPGGRTARARAPARPSPRRSCADRDRPPAARGRSRASSCRRLPCPSPRAARVPVATSCRAVFLKRARGRDHAGATYNRADEHAVDRRSDRCAGRL